MVILGLDSAHLVLDSPAGLALLFASHRLIGQEVDTRGGPIELRPDFTAASLQYPLRFRLYLTLRIVFSFQP